jgi:GNAT superfamily N-acetyltransferase
MHSYIREAAIIDAVAACNVLRRSIVECCCRDHRNEPDLVEAWLRNKTPENVRNWLTGDGYAVVAELEGSVVGFALLLASGEVALCYLVPEAHSLGLGRGMVSAMEAEAARRGLVTLCLESTATARSFYLHNGFLPSGPAVTAFGIEAFPMNKRVSAIQSIGGDATSATRR